MTMETADRLVTIDHLEELLLTRKATQRGFNLRQDAGRCPLVRVRHGYIHHIGAR